MPLVSVLLPTHARNKSGLLSKAISSVLAQDFSDFELFVIDDGSSDGSVETIQEFCNLDKRVRHIRFEENVGLPALTAAHALKQSSGKYIAWQFDDCTWMSNHLIDLVEAAQKAEKPSIVYGQAKVKTKDGEIVFGEKFVATDLEHRNFIPNVSTLTDRRVFDQIGWFDPSITLKRINDYDFWVRASKEFNFVFIPKVVAVENGTVLNDSLGNSVSLFSDLTSRVIKSERNDYLQLSNVDNWKPFMPAEWMDEADKERVAYLTFEHFLRIKKLHEGIIVTSKILGTSINEPIENHIYEVINWYVKKSKEIFVPNDPLPVGYFRYIYNCLKIYGIKGIIPITKAVIRVTKRKIFS